MKNILFSFLTLFLFATSCTSQKYIETGLLTKLVDDQEFTFMAERVNITNGDVLNTIGAIPGASVARMQDLSYGNGIVFNKGTMNINLPYFGRVYNPSRTQEKSGFYFSTSDYTISKSEGKKGGKTITVKPNDNSNISTIYLEISSNGKCYVSINANDRQPISYSGFIMKNEIKK